MALNFYKIVRGLFLSPQSTTPSSPQNGDIYFDATLGQFRFRENNDWASLAAGSGTKNYLDSILTSLSSGVRNPGNGDFEKGTTAGWSTVGTAAVSGSPSQDPAVPGVPGQPYQSGQYIFRVGSASATAGATYTNNGQTFTILATVASGPYFVCTGTGAPTSTGTLTLSSGTGDASVIYAQRVSTSSVNMTMTPVTSGQLAGSTSGQWNASAATVSGNGVISDAFYIDKEDQNKVLGFSFYYEFTSGASNVTLSGDASSNLGIYVYDVDNATWIVPNAGTFGFIQSSGVGKVVGKFQTSSTGTRYQLFFGCRSGSTGAFTVLVDDFVVGPSNNVVGPAIGSWTPYTPTFSLTTAVSGATGMYRRIGDSIECQVLANFSGANGQAIAITFSLPPGMAIDTTKLLSGASSNSNFLGNFGFVGTSVTNALQASYNSATSIFVRKWVSTTGTNSNIYQLATTGSDLSTQNGNYLYGSFIVPIVGFSTNVIQAESRTFSVSQYAQTRVTGTNPTQLGQYRSYLRTASTGSFSDTNGTPAELPSQANGFALYDGNGWGSTDNSNHPTAYDIFVGRNKVVQFVAWSATGKSNSISLDVMQDTNFQNIVGSQCYYDQNTGIASINTAFNSAATSTNRPGHKQNQTITKVYFDVIVSEAPATLAIAPFIGARYTRTGSAQTIPSSTASTKVLFNTMVYDSHSAYSNGDFVAPVTGYYRVSAAVTRVATSLTIGYDELEVWIDGVQAVNGYRNNAAIGTAAVGESSSISTTVKLNAGQSLSFYLYDQSANSANSVAASAGSCWMCIEKVDN